MTAGGEGAPARPHNGSRNEVIRFFVVVLVIGLIVAYLNRGHVEQQENYASEYVRMANYYRGLASRSVLTYPMWGYSLVLLALPRYDLVAIPQVILGAFVATLLFVALREELPTHKRGIAILFVAALPWYALHSVKWPQSFAASFCLLGLLVLARGLRRNSVALGATAGLLFGAALYFRSEFLYLPLFIVCVAIASAALRRYERVPIAPAFAAAVIAWAVLTPWAIHYHRLTGRYSLTASQRGIVAFISLGQLPGNPWGATYLDEYAYDYLRQQRIDVIPQSDSGDRVLYNEFKRRVRAHPVAFAEKTAWNAVMTMAGGFYNPEVPLSADENTMLGEFRSRLLSRRTATEANSRAPQISARVYGALFFWAFAKFIGALFVSIATLGLLIAAWRGIRSRLLLLLAAYIAYQFLLLLALATEPRYLNGLYLALVPFFLSACAAARDFWTKRAFRTRAVSPVPA